MDKIFADELEKLTSGQVKTRIFHSGSLSSTKQSWLKWHRAALWTRASRRAPISWAGRPR